MSTEALNIVSYHDKQLEKDEAFLYRFYEYTTKLMEHHAKQRDLDDSFFEYLQKSSMECAESSFNKQLLSVYIKNHAVSLFQLSAQRERKIKELEEKLVEFYTNFKSFDGFKKSFKDLKNSLKVKRYSSSTSLSGDSAREFSIKPVNLNDLDLSSLEHTENSVIIWIMNLFKDLIEVELKFNCASIEINTNAYRRHIETRSKLLIKRNSITETGGLSSTNFLSTTSESSAGVFLSSEKE